MLSILKPISKFSFALAVSTGLMASLVQAQNKTEVAEACIQAIEAGDKKTATEIASQMKDWRNLFNVTVIKNSEQCLQTATGKHWEYFTTKGRFLSGDEAQAEQAFVEGSEDRRSKRVGNLKRLRCEVTIAEFELGKLEAEYKNIKAARTLEAIRATQNACRRAYETDQGAALLNPVCNDGFKSVGIPNTEYEFDNAKLEMARLEKIVSEINLWKALRPNAKISEATNLQVKECRELLAE